MTHELEGWAAELLRVHAPGMLEPPSDLARRYEAIVALCVAHRRALQCLADAPRPRPLFELPWSAESQSWYKRWDRERDLILAENPVAVPAGDVP